MNIRFDSIKMPKVSKTPEGYLRGDVVVSRSGVFKYQNSDGTIRGELRHPEDVFKKESLDTLKMIPITNNHPPEFVSAANSHKYQVGYTGERYDVMNDKVIVSITVTHQDAIDAILNGKLELSMGYDVSLQEEKGTYENQKYDFRQLAPKYNHLAIVERGRAGSEVRFRFDSAYEQVESNNLKLNNGNKNNGNKNMSEDKSNIDDNSRLDAAIAKNDTLKAECNLLQEKLDKALERIDLREKSYDKLSREYDEEKSKKADDIIDKKVMDRVELFLNAAPFLKDIESYMKHTDREIMEAAMNAARSDSMDLTDRTDDHVQGMFELFVGANTRRADSGTMNKIFSVIKQRSDTNSGGGSIHEVISKRSHDDWYKKQYGDK
jgi:hypothetical protein